MACLTVLSVLVVALLQVQTLAIKQTLYQGEEYRQDCALSDTREGYIVQFFIDRTEIKMFNSKTYSDKLRVISNGKTIVASLANYTDRYSVEENDGRYKLLIKNVTDSDSAWYGCRSFNLELNMTGAALESIELLVPGPFNGIFWTANYSGLSLDVARQHEIPDGGLIITDKMQSGPDVACAVLVSNVEPVVNITIGGFGQPGSVDITDQFDIRSSSVVTTYNGGTRYRSTEFFVKNFGFAKSLRDVSCRASALGKTYETSFSIQVTSRPKNTKCDPMYFNAEVGSKNVALTCLIEAHPEPFVEWILPSGQQINALSNNPNYAVTNKAGFGGLFTTLTISEITEGIDDFGRIEINATNTEGSGISYLFFREGVEGDFVAAAGIKQASATLVTMATGLLLWMLK